MKRRAVVIGAGVLAVVAAAIVWMRSGGPPEPVYQGKTLSAWLDDRRATRSGSVVLSDEAVAAVRALGPEALPTLLAWLSASDSPVRRRAKILLEWQLGLPVHVATNQESRIRAMYGFRTLGAAAKSAFPALVAIALNSPDDWQRSDAINALTDSDADTMRRLAAGLRSPDREVRLRAVFALSCIRIAPDEVCIPALEGAVNDSDAEVRDKAAKGIALFNDQLARIAAWLDVPDAELRLYGVQGLAGYRTRAREFLPKLEAAAKDDDPRVREAAAMAIQQVRGGESPRTDSGIVDKR